MGLSSLVFLIHEGFLNIRRNGLMSLAALGTMTVALTVLGASLWTAYRLHEIAAQQPQRFNEIDAFLYVSADRSQTLQVRQRLEALPEVEQVHLIPKEQAWRDWQTNEAPIASQAMTDNPLPDKLEVVARDAAQVGHLAALLRDKGQFPEFEDVEDASQAVRTMIGFARLIRVIGGGVGLGLFIATLFIVYNTIRLTVYARRREIRIMQLVGATPGFIRFPLLLEGLFHGLVGAAIAGGLVLLGGREVSRFVSDLHSPLIGDVPSLLGSADVVGGLVAIGVLVGLVGSHLAMRRFLKQA